MGERECHARELAALRLRNTHSEQISGLTKCILEKQIKGILENILY